MCCCWRSLVWKEWVFQNVWWEYFREFCFQQIWLMVVWLCVAFFRLYWKNFVVSEANAFQCMFPPFFSWIGFVFCLFVFRNRSMQRGVAEWWNRNVEMSTLLYNNYGWIFVLNVGFPHSVSFYFYIFSRFFRFNLLHCAFFRFLFLWFWLASSFLLPCLFDSVSINVSVFVRFYSDGKYVRRKKMPYAHNEEL